MLKNYFKITFRNIIRNPLYSTINISGLAIGIISIILISLWVNYELGHDGFHKNKDRIYKIQQGNNFSTVPPLFNYIIDTAKDKGRVKSLCFSFLKQFLLVYNNYTLLLHANP